MNKKIRYILFLVVFVSFFFISTPLINAETFDVDIGGTVDPYYDTGTDTGTTTSGYAFAASAFVKISLVDVSGSYPRIVSSLYYARADDPYYNRYKTSNINGANMLCGTISGQTYYSSGCYLVSVNEVSWMQGVTVGGAGRSAGGLNYDANALRSKFASNNYELLREVYFNLAAATALPKDFVDVTQAEVDELRKHIIIVEPVYAFQYRGGLYSFFTMKGLFSFLLNTGKESECVGVSFQAFAGNALATEIHGSINSPSFVSISGIMSPSDIINEISRTNSGYGYGISSIEDLYDEPVDEPDDDPPPGIDVRIIRTSCGVDADFNCGAGRNDLKTADNCSQQYIAYIYLARYDRMAEVIGKASFNETVTMGYGFNNNTEIFSGGGFGFSSSYQSVASWGVSDVHCRNCSEHLRIIDKPDDPSTPEDETTYQVYRPDDPLTPQDETIYKYVTLYYPLTGAEMQLVTDSFNRTAKAQYNRYSFRDTSTIAFPSSNDYNDNTKYQNVGRWNCTYRGQTDNSGTVNCNYNLYNAYSDLGGRVTYSGNPLNNYQLLESGKYYTPLNCFGNFLFGTTGAVRFSSLRFVNYSKYINCNVSCKPEFYNPPPDEGYAFNYRVIDLDDPFPNLNINNISAYINASQNGLLWYGDNWLVWYYRNVFNNNMGIIQNRQMRLSNTYNNSPDYSITMDTETVGVIKGYNYSEKNNGGYLANNYDWNGNSDFIDDFRSYFNISDAAKYSRIGECNCNSGCYNLATSGQPDLVCGGGS